MDTYNGTDPFGAEKSMINHLKAIRRNRFYARARIYVMFEANGDWDRAGRAAAAIQQVIPNVTFVKNEPRNDEARPGVLTTPTNRPAALAYTKQLLVDDDIYVSADPHFVCGDTNPEAPSKNMRMLVEQLRGFKRNRKVSDHPEMTAVKETLSGKDSSGQQDDFVLALAMGLWHMHYIIRKNRRFY